MKVVTALEHLPLTCHHIFNLFFYEDWPPGGGCVAGIPPIRLAVTFPLVTQ